MKKTMLFILSSVLTLGVFAQAVPEFRNTPMLVKADGTLGTLEKQTTEVKSKTAGGMWGAAYGGAAATMMYTVFKEVESPIRVDKSATFIVKVNEDEDPETLFNLTSAVIVKKNKTREIYTQKSGGKSVKESYVKLKFEKVSPGVYKIIPSGLTPATEYGFISSAKAGTVFLFGVN